MSDGAGLRTGDRIEVERDLSVCPFCGLVTMMNRVDWGDHVNACAAIEAGLERLRAERNRKAFPKPA